MVRASISEASGKGNELSNNLSQKRQRSSMSPGTGAKRGNTEGKRRWKTQMDLDILDCPICFEALTIPIFQCDNGHLACSSCRPKLSNKCPTCASPVGHNRCRAMETVLESVYLPCRNAKFGCNKTVTYGKKLAHEKDCNFSPTPKGNYTKSYKGTDVKGCDDGFMHNLFSFGVPHRFRLNITDRILIKMEHTTSLMLALQCFREPYGVYITVTCMTSSYPKVGELSYRLSYTVDGNTMTYKSSKVRRNQELSFQTPTENFMSIPQSLLRGDLLEMEMKLCIRNSKVGAI